eukprot:1422065-Pyramimonas_sp.AAC.1
MCNLGHIRHGSAARGRDRRLVRHGAVVLDHDQAPEGGVEDIFAERARPQLSLCSRQQQLPSPRLHALPETV